MERKEAMKASAIYVGEDKGAGGKLRKPLVRKKPSTPYDRPPQSKTVNQSENGWLSKLVDPAFRLISRSSTRLLPSFFSRSALTDDLPSSIDYDPVVRRDACDDDERQTSSVEISTLENGRAGAPKSAGRSNYSSPSAQQEKFKVENVSDESLSEIEEMMRGKTFSRDEVDRLTEILHSKGAGLSSGELTNKNQSMTPSRVAEGPLLAHKGPSTGPSRGALSSGELTNKVQSMTPSIVAQGAVPTHKTVDEVGASPIEIARAYMGSRTSEIGPGSKSTLFLKDKRDVKHSYEVDLKPYLPLASPQPAICWPGAIVKEQRGYFTPQSQRSRFGLNNFSRTPYSRDVFSKSKSKLTRLQGDSTMSLNMLSTPVQKSHTPVGTQVQSRTSVPVDAYGSVGPIRRTRHKYVSESPSQFSVSLMNSQNDSFHVDNSSSSKEFEVGVSTVPPQSTQIARKILEHLDRKVSTPAEKSLELKLATAWRKSISSDSKHGDSELDSSKMLEFRDQMLSTQRNEDRGNSVFEGRTKVLNTKEAYDAADRAISASDIVLGGTGLILNGDAGSSLDFEKTHPSQVESMHEISLEGPCASSSVILNQQKKPPTTSSTSRPRLASISINKPDSRTTFTFNNTMTTNNNNSDINNKSSGFTFPVSISSSVLSEPPTPSIMPSFSLGGLSQVKEPAVPTFTFGSQRSKQPLVFSFPSTSSSSSDGDSLDIKFSFGSDMKNRVSFGSIGKDAICY